MHGRVTETPLYTAEQVKGHLDDAARIVSELELTDDLRVPAFKAAVELLAKKHVMQEIVQPGVPDLAIRRGI